MKIKFISSAIAVLLLAPTLALADNCNYGDKAMKMNYTSANDQGGLMQVGSHSKPDIVDTALSAGTFNTLVAAVTAAELVETLKGEGPFTVFAPTDEAFEKVPAEALKALLADKEALRKVLLYHVVAGRVASSDVVKLSSATTAQGSDVTIDATDGVKINGATVVKADIMTSNGIIHVIDQVLMPSEPDIVDTAVSAGFNTLVAAVTAAELVETLKGDGPFTVFAPTDEAFAKIPADTLKALLADKEALTKVLLYHVVPGKVAAEDVMKLKSATTAQGSDVMIDTSDGVKINGATVVKADVMTSNGIIHVIDTVLMPK